MPWKAWLEGHEFDLQTLVELFRTGDPLVVAQDSSNGYFFESSELQQEDQQLDYGAGEALIKRINGIGRANDYAFRPVRLTGRYTGPNGETSVVVGTAAIEARGKVVANALINRILALEPLPKGPRYAKVAEQDADVADALRVLGQPGELDWYDVYKAWEIVEHAVGGMPKVAARGWATKADIERLTASANHPGISGDDARHARTAGG